MEQPNLSYIRSMSDGDEAFEKKLIDIIKEEFPKEKQVYFKNSSSRDFKATAEIVHKLKHKISIFGLIVSYELAVNYEHNLLENSIEGEKDFESVLQLITDFLKTL